MKKLKKLEPAVSVIPWTERAYASRKRSCSAQGLCCGELYFYFQDVDNNVKDIGFTNSVAVFVL